MKRIWVAIAVLAVSLASAESCLGHGARCTSIEGASAVEAVYHQGGPMAFCDVEVFRPGGGEETFHTGTTDALGRFAFVPDTTGEWRIVVDDGMGHTATAEMVIGPGAIEAQERGAPDRMSGLIVGVSVVFGLFGLFSLLTRWTGRAG